MLEGTLVLIVKSIVIFAVFLQIVPLILLGERKLLGRFQSRIGPNRVGPKGLAQPRPDRVSERGRYSQPTQPSYPEASMSDRR